MGENTFERLARENPVPGPMEQLPIEPVLARLGAEPPRSRPPRRRQALRAVPAVTSVIVAVAVATVMITALDHHRSKSTPTSTAAHPSRPTHATVARTMLLDSLLPVGMAPATGNRLVLFTQLARAASMESCLSAKGLPAALAAATSSPRLTRVVTANATVMTLTGTARGTMVPTRPVRTHTLPRRARAEYGHAVRVCSAAVASKDIGVAGRDATRLSKLWTHVFATVSASPAMRAADDRAAACSRTTPFPARTIVGETKAVQTKLNPLFVARHDARARALSEKAMRVFVRCFGPVEALSVRLMSTQRIRFTAEHRAAIRRLVRQVDATGTR